MVEFQSALAGEFKEKDLSHETVHYWYEGRCSRQGIGLRLPRTPGVEAIAHTLMEQLVQDECYSREGKMYGVLLVEMPNGERQVLKAFSGLLNGESQVDGWVPPIGGRELVAQAEAQTLAQLDAIKHELLRLQHLPERQQYDSLKKDFDTRLQALTETHHQKKLERQQQRQQMVETLEGEALAIALIYLDDQSRRDGMERRHLKRQRDEALRSLTSLVESADARIRSLRHQRKALSQQLQAQMHAVYHLTNFAGESLPLQQLMPVGTIPTGTGDCCAPKLLHYAALQGWKPLAMAEFWWGPPPPKGDKVQGQFYGACAERCQPIMGFLLSGLSESLPMSVHQDSDTDVYSQSLSLGHGKGVGAKPQPLSHGLTKVTMAINSPSPSFEHQEKADIEYPFSLGNQTKMAMALTTIYKDEWLIAVNKPAGLLSVPGRGSDRHDSLLTRLQLLEGTRLIPVHRLDQDTSGILLFARDMSTYRHLSQQFQQRQVHKVYEAVLMGILDVEHCVIELPLWSDPGDRPYQKVDWERGKPSTTHVSVIANDETTTRVEMVPLTGRTHQLRVHAAHPEGLGAAIVGDRLYGNHSPPKRLHLHARELRFYHPHQKEWVHLKAATPF